MRTDDIPITKVMPIGIFVNDIRIFDEFSIWSF